MLARVTVAGPRGPWVADLLATDDDAPTGITDEDLAEHLRPAVGFQARRGGGVLIATLEGAPA